MSATPQPSFLALPKHMIPFCFYLSSAPGHPDRANRLQRTVFARDSVGAFQQVRQALLPLSRHRGARFALSGAEPCRQSWPAIHSQGLLRPGAGCRRRIPEAKTPPALKFPNWSGNAPWQGNANRSPSPDRLFREDLPGFDQAAYPSPTADRSRAFPRWRWSRPLSSYFGRDWKKRPTMREATSAGWVVT